MPMTVLMPKPISDAIVVSSAACERSLQSLKIDLITLDGAGTRNDRTHPARTAISASTVTSTSGASGGRTLRMNRRVNLIAARLRAPALPAARPSRGQIVHRRAKHYRARLADRRDGRSPSAPDEA